MPLIIKAIQWSPMPRVPHGIIGTIAGRTGVRRVAGIINENDSPKRPRGLPSLAKPFTLELYLPLNGGQDRILKFTEEAGAKREATRQLLAFIQDTLESMT